MNKQDLLKLTKDPKYISGIYNYCDRWCERCPFTSRCLNYNLVDKQFGDFQENDEINEAFWQRLSDDYLFYEKDVEINRIRLAPRNNPLKEAVEIKDAIEVIRWYQ